MRYLCFLPFAAVLLAANARAATTAVCHPSTEIEIAGLFDRWNASLQTGDPEKIVANYAKKSVLLATVSNKPRLTPDEKTDYFEHFVKGKPVGTIDSRNIELGCNSATDAGLYTFKFADGKQVKARYTYTYKWDGKQWLITSHHSSKMPEQN